MEVNSPSDNTSDSENQKVTASSPEEKHLLNYKKGDKTENYTETSISTNSLYDPNKSLFSPTDSLNHSDPQVPGCSDDGSIYETPHAQKPERTAVSCEKVDIPTTPPKKVEFKTPIPLLPWADSDEVWQNMIYKEENTCKQRSYKVFEGKATYLPRMRAILLDWIMEVCEVYRLRRNTYYLGVDYIDRYLTSNSSVPKTQLQLLGITCVYIAAKLDEIYPPKLSEFSYVCDGACTEEEIIKCESLLLFALDWDVNPMTPTGWLNLYMQLHHNAEFVRAQRLTVHDDSHFQYPQYSSYQFVRASQLMDLFSMDPGFLRFNYSIIAASAMFYLYGKKIALSVSGVPWDELKKCVEYMSIFCYTISTEDDPRLLSILVDEQDDRLEKSFKFVKIYVPNIISDENHAIQTHIINLDYFEKSIVHRIQSYGMEVNKVYLKRQTNDVEDKKESENGEQLETTEDLITKEEPKEGPLVVMYEIIPSKRSLTPKEQIILHPTDADFQPGLVDVFRLAKTAVATFDDILNSIYNDMPDFEEVDLYIESKCLCNPTSRLCNKRTTSLQLAEDVAKLFIRDKN